MDDKENQNGKEHDCKRDEEKEQEERQDVSEDLVPGERRPCSTEQTIECASEGSLFMSNDTGNGGSKEYTRNKVSHNMNL
ncbi:hypothetical protein RUM44_003897 [Polyplax serrata]|uniref:Uncharacterized protein n=1 Tax=Polyplax serrata TaxID=468196 RepID=A0ABR1B1A4_POLSC